jgi:hypothetical protein
MARLSKRSTRKGARTSWLFALVALFVFYAFVPYVGAQEEWEGDQEEWEGDYEEAAPSEPKSETSGLALGIGFGYQYAMLGGQLLYYIRLPGVPLQIVPYAGGGYFPSIEEGLDGSPGFSAGTMVGLGNTHRLVLDVNYGLAALQYITATKETKTLYGLTVAIGYEYMSDPGFFVRPQFGATYFIDKPEDPDKSRFVPTLNIGLGMKFW